MSKSRQKFQMNGNTFQFKRGDISIINSRALDFEENTVRLEKNGNRRSKKGDPRGKSRKEYYDNW